MTLDELIARFARNNGIEPLTFEDGRYLIPLEGVAVYCFQEADQACLLAEIAPLAKSESQQQSQSRLLLEKNMGLIQEQRSVLTLDTDSNTYQLYQRLPLQELRQEVFQEAVEKFGGCGLYYKGILGAGGNSHGSTASPGNMMMP